MSKVIITIEGEERSNVNALAQIDAMRKCLDDSAERERKYKEDIEQMQKSIQSLSEAAVKASKQWRMPKRGDWVKCVTNQPTECDYYKHLAKPEVGKEYQVHNPSSLHLEVDEGQFAIEVKVGSSCNYWPLSCFEACSVE